MAAVIGQYFLSQSHAATPFVSAEPESGTLTAPASKVADATASGVQAVKFGTTVVPGSCIGALNAPGGPDPWGGCWPGPQNTGYPKGLPGDTRTPVTLTNYTGPQEIKTCGAVIENKIVPWLYISAGNGTHSPNTPCITIKNSWVKGTVTSDSGDVGARRGRGLARAKGRIAVLGECCADRAP